MVERNTVSPGAADWTTRYDADIRDFVRTKGLPDEGNLVRIQFNLEMARLAVYGQGKNQKIYEALEEALLRKHAPLLLETIDWPDPD